MYNLARGIERALKEAGVAIHTDHEVARIVKNGNCVGGIVFENGRRISADVIVSNMEVTPAYAELLGEEASFLRRFEKFEPSCSGVVLHLGTNKIFPSLAHHNFFFSRDPRRSYKAVFDDYTIPDDPTLYVVAPCRTDPGQAPAGCDNIKILPQFPHLGVKRFSEGDIADFRDRILAKLERMGLTGLRESIVAEDLWTPYDLERRYRSNKGSIYGVVCDRTKNFALKASKRSSRYKNLFFVGGSVNPGGGMPMVVLGGMKAADLVCKAFP
jgi:diapolycopene oxygenase